ncbi:MAG: hypothetical protein JW934_02335, partial [Anaerolineae bacterium]|nr:hypothetical protein [Anaerolineae bacterium]
MKRWMFLFVSVLSMVALAGCSAESTGPVVEAQMPVRRDVGVVVAEGVVTPTRAGYLAFKLGGDVAQVWVKE